MATQSTTGVGNGSAEGLNKGPGNKRTIYAPLNGPCVLAAGEVWDNDDVWQLEVRIPGINENPDDITVLVTQSDWTNYDGRGDNPPHIEKIDSNGNNFEDSDYIEDCSGDYCVYKWEPGVTFAGFIIHTGDDDGTDSGYPRKFGYIVLKTGGGKSFGSY